MTNHSFYLLNKNHCFFKQAAVYFLVHNCKGSHSVWIRNLNLPFSLFICLLDFWHWTSFFPFCEPTFAIETSLLTLLLVHLLKDKLFQPQAGLFYHWWIQVELYVKLFVYYLTDFICNKTQFYKILRCLDNSKDKFGISSLI